MALVGNLITKLGLDSSEFNRGMQKARRESNSFSKATKMLGAALAGLALERFASKAVKAASDFEQSRVKFEAFLGSAEAATAMLRELDKFNLKTPFETEQIQQASITLLGFGLESEKLIQTLKVLGDVSGGNGEALGRLAVAFGQARAEGRVMGRDLTQFINNGVPLIGMLAEEMGVAEEEVRSLASAGEISFDILESAMVRATSEGGMFFDMMNKQSATFAGTMSNLDDATTIFMRNLGEYLLPTLKVAAGDAISTMDTLNGKMNDLGNNEGPNNLAINFKLAIETTKQGFNVMFNTVAQYWKEFIAGIAGGVGSLATLFGQEKLAASALAEAGTAKVAAGKFKGNADTAKMLLQIMGAHRDSGTLGEFFGISGFTSVGGGGGGAGSTPPPSAQGAGHGFTGNSNNQSLLLKLVGTPAELETIRTGVTSVFDMLQEKAQGVTAVAPKLTEQFGGMVDVIGGAVGGIFDKLVSGGQKFGQFFKELIKKLVVQALKMLAIFAALSIFTGGAGAAFSAIGGAVGVVKGLFSAFAQGGIVSKPTMGLVGEYPSAPTDPEVIGRASTIAKVVKGFMGSGGGGQQLVAKVQGKDLILMLREASFDNGANGGPQLVFN